jgi:hypothetical protein
VGHGGTTSSGPWNSYLRPFSASTCFSLTMACMEVVHVGHGGTTSSGLWNSYLRHQLNRTYVDTLGGRLDDAAILRRLYLRVNFEPHVM